MQERRENDEYRNAYTLGRKGTAMYVSRAPGGVRRRDR